MASDFRIWPVSIPVLIQFLEAAASHPHEDVREIAKFAGVSESTARKSLSTLTALELVGRDDKGRIATITPDVRRGIEIETARQVLRRALIRYRPFELMVEGLALSEPLLVAIRKAATLLALSTNELGKFDHMVRWGADLGILVRGKAGDVALAAELGGAASVSSPILTAEDVESEAKARLYISARLGRSVYNHIDEHERTLLAEAMLTFNTAPADAVEKAGQAVENHLRETAQKLGLAAEAKKMNGSGQLAALLVSHAHIHGHQQKLIEAVGTLRNAKAHHKDKKTLQPWQITDLGAFVCILTALAAIRSVHEYIYSSLQSL